MGGFFGAVSKNDCKYEVFFGTDYHSHLGTRRAGMAVYSKESGFDKAARILASLPRFILLPVVRLIIFLDNNHLLPQALIDVSPFHGSLFVTSMGSLGIRPIYHHLYNFGNLPIFASYGNKRMELCLDDEGNVRKKRMIDLKVVTDERICDGYLYASAFKTIRTYLEHPQVLEQAPDAVREDID